MFVGVSVGVSAGEIGLPVEEIPCDRFVEQLVFVGGGTHPPSVGWAGRVNDERKLTITSQ